jgi:hypothetical protein
MSEANGYGAEVGTANGQLARQDGRAADSAADAGDPPDSWFRPEPRAAEGNGGPGPGPGAGPAADGSLDDTAQWFLRTGRAGLLPDSMTVSWDDAAPAAQRSEPAGAPPWAGDGAASTADEAPPWESGPWPGPGETMPDPNTEAAPEYGPPGPASLRPGGPPQPPDPGNWQATAAAAAGILPLVLPGAVLGVLGLRRARATGTGRAASWTGIGLSAVWAVVLVIWLAAGGGSTPQACGSYQRQVSYPVAQVLHDLSAGAPESVLTSDVHLAISRANAAAAATADVAARDAMVSLTAGLQDSLTRTSSSRSAATFRALGSQLTADMSAVTRSCAS